MKIAVKNNDNGHLVFDLCQMAAIKRPESIWIPDTYTIVDIKAAFVLIMEKESVLVDMVQQGFLQRYPNSILITAKGYADLNTKYLIREMFRYLPHIPYLYIGDYDPHGIDIFMNYCYGSKMTIYENCDLPFIEFIGVDARDMSLPYSALTPEDINKCQQVLDSPVIYAQSSISASSSFGRLQDMKRQHVIDMIRHMMANNFKCDIESLSVNSKLIPYIDSQLSLIDCRPIN